MEFRGRSATDGIEDGVGTEDLNEARNCIKEVGKGDRIGVRACRGLVICHGGDAADLLEDMGDMFEEADEVARDGFVDRLGSGSGLLRRFKVQDASQVEVRTGSRDTKAIRKRPITLTGHRTAKVCAED